jgi:hypothetical protein
MVMWNNPIFYPLTHSSIVQNAPDRSGVFALYSKPRWVYVGEAENIYSQLMHFLRGPSVCVSAFRSLTFSYELLSPTARVERQTQLIMKLRPVCNGCPE